MKTGIDRGFRPTVGMVGLIIVTLLSLWLLISAARIIGAGERGVLLHWGAVQPTVLNQGLHFLMPIRSKIVKMNVQVVKYQVKATAFSKDLQTADAIIAVNYHVIPNEVGVLYDEIGKDYEDRIIAPSVQEVTKAVTAKFVAQELVEKRQEVRDGVFDQLKEQLVSRHIAVDDVSIVNFDFSDEYEKAIEQKQVAQQNALTAENVLKQTKIEAQQRIETAKGEAEAIRVKSEAITKQGGADYLRLKAIERWDGGVPQYISGGDSDILNLLVQAPTNAK